MRVVHVVNHGWHSGLVVERAALDGAAVAAEFPHADHLEFGWGDAGYYPAERFGVWLALRALFWPTPTVLHVAGFSGEVTNTFPYFQIVRVELSEPGFARLRAHIETSFACDSAGRLQPVGPGWYGDSRFYRARGKFFFPKMCNYWAAAGLRAAGCPVNPWCTITAGQLTAQTRRFGTVIQSR